MLKGKKGPYILLALLTICLFFILGIQYGKKVEHADKTIDYLLSMSPTQKASPTGSPHIKYDTFESDICGISFLYPSNISIISNAKEQAQLSSKDKLQFIDVSCGAGILSPSSKTVKQISLANRPATMTEISRKLSSKSIKAIEYRVKNPINNKLIIATVEADLSPLIIKSLEFTN